MAQFYLRCLVWVLAMAVTYVAFAAPLFRRGLVHDDPDAGYLKPHPEGVGYSRLVMLAIAIVLGSGAGFGFYTLYHSVDAQTWQNYCFPAMLGCAISLIYGPIRLWHRLRPWV